MINVHVGNGVQLADSERLHSLRISADLTVGRLHVSVLQYM